jgi:hypothetical protein
VSDGLVTHCLAPHSLLRELRGVLVPEPPQRSARRTVVFASREGQRMRHLQDEAGLIADIEAGAWQKKQELPPTLLSVTSCLCCERAQSGHLACQNHFRWLYRERPRKYRGSILTRLHTLLLIHGGHHTSREHVNIQQAFITCSHAHHPPTQSSHPTTIFLSSEGT